MTANAPPLGRILTFYSYKGGTGRSMAVANIAWLLACAGRRVLAIDWDLEAPGLHRYFRPFLIDEEVTASDGLMDLVDNYASEAIRPLKKGETRDPQWYVPYADFSDYIVSINFPHFRAGGKIDFLPAGRQGNHYALLVSSFNWQNFYDRLGGGGFIEAFKNQARSLYDYVLIDSRTGVSDTAGICSVQLPDSLVVCFTYNNQSIKGASAVARSATVSHEKLVDEKLSLLRSGKSTNTSVEDLTRPYRVFPVPMRVDSGESDRLAIRQAFARHSFAGLIDHVGLEAVSGTWKSVEVPHTSFYSYEEVLAAFKDDAYDPKTVLAALLRLTRHVTDRDVNEFQLPLAPEKKQEFLDAFAETPLTTTTQRILVDSQRESAEQTLVRSAEVALSGLPGEERAAAKRILGRLVRLGGDDEGGGYFPIRVSLTDFDEADHKLIEKLSSHRVLSILLEPRSPSRPPERTVGIADARLLTSWGTLIAWLDEDHDFLQWRQQLRVYLSDWERSGRDAGALLSGRLLSVADLYTLRRTGDLNAAEIEYIEQSRASARAPASDTAAREERSSSAPFPSIQRPIPTSSRGPGRSSSFLRIAGAFGAVALIALAVLLANRTFGPSQNTPPGTSTAPPSTSGAPPTTSGGAAPPTSRPTFKVPRLIGLSLVDASNVATRLDLKIATADGKSPDTPTVQGVVVEQEPKEGALLPSGGVIRVTLSTLTSPAPTLVGLDLAKALESLDAARLRIGTTDSRYVADATMGRVIEQRPAPGTAVAVGSEVSVTVARAAQLNDFRIVINFLQDNRNAALLAEEARGLLRAAGSQAEVQARDAQYFEKSQVKKGRHEIRYSSAERVIITQILRQLQPLRTREPFVPTLVTLRPDNIITIHLDPATAGVSRQARDD